MPYAIKSFYNKFFKINILSLMLIPFNIANAQLEYGTITGGSETYNPSFVFVFNIIIFLSFSVILFRYFKLFVLLTSRPKDNSKNKIPYIIAFLYLVLLLFGILVENFNSISYNTRQTFIVFSIYSTILFYIVSFTAGFIFYILRKIRLFRNAKVTDNNLISLKKNLYIHIIHFILFFSLGYLVNYFSVIYCRNFTLGCPLGW